ncbi:hypothetical protein CC86DRAFT_409795 [Ophiobolus disseminans]|uniref:Mid2 domain-containing protein n=1 Tax=Ophiobolus disseminans TaxID=1469910 RepID=A0A6A6ZQH0_9PLEO|nr:hypothetical protein CC86DRAFT_409795 [Ophiobolus disseminans]
MAVTAPAVLQPRAETATFCWWSSGAVGDSIFWEPVRYDPAKLFITSSQGFSIWVYACNDGANWCDTATIATTCGDGFIRAMSLTSSCAKCWTELMYQRYGDAEPKLSLVGCDAPGGSYSAKTFYVESPPARKGIASTLPTVTTATVPTLANASPITPTPSNTSTSTTPAQTAVSAASESRNDGPSVGLIAGSVIGGVAVLGIIGLIALWIVRRHGRHQPHTTDISATGPQYAASSPGVAEYPIYRAELPPQNRAELPPHAFSTHGRSELEDGGRISVPRY